MTLLSPILTFLCFQVQFNFYDFWLNKLKLKTSCIDDLFCHALEVVEEELTCVKIIPMREVIAYALQ